MKLLLSKMLVGVILIAPISSLASDTAWVRTYPNATWTDQDITMDRSGNMYVTGTIHSLPVTDLDYVTIKYLPTGDTAWVRSFNSAADVDDRVVAVGTDTLGNVYVTGHSDPGIAFPDKKIVTVKYDASDNLLWASAYDPPYPPDSNRLALPMDMIVDEAGNAYVAGYHKGKGTRRTPLSSSTARTETRPGSGVTAASFFPILHSMIH